jgi:hypothetical protein
VPPSTIKSSIAVSARWHDMWWGRCIGATLKPPARQEPMTIALLIALAGSLAAMAVIVRRLEQR